MLKIYLVALQTLKTDIYGCLKCKTWTFYSHKLDLRTCVKFEVILLKYKLFKIRKRFIFMSPFTTKYSKRVRLGIDKWYYFRI